MTTSLFGGYPGARLIGQEERLAVDKIINARSPYRFYGIAPQHTAISLEASLAHLLRRKFALGVSSGTAALHTSLFALGVGRGDEVVLPAYAWSADLMAILAVGAVPVIAPLDDTLGLCPDRLDSCLSSRTKSIIAVHMRGQPCDIARIAEVAKKRGIPLVEDGSQCLGGEVDNCPVGQFGTCSVFSFQYNKLITGGEGGALLTDDQSTFLRARRFHDLGMAREPGQADPLGEDAIASFGLNYRISELQAALINTQLDRMPDILYSLQSAFTKSLQMLAPICRQYGLDLRKRPLRTKPNHAFVVMTAGSAVDAESAITKLTQTGVPAVSCARQDAHHYRTWISFLNREGISFSDHTDVQTAEILERSFFAEIRSDFLCETGGAETS